MAPDVSTRPQHRTQVEVVLIAMAESVLDAPAMRTVVTPQAR